MSKVTKFAKSPGLFVRDYLLRRHPLDVQADINRTSKHDKAPVKKTPKVVKTETLLDGFIGAAFPVDIVYTWVDLDDPAFREKKRQYLGRDASYKPEAVHDSRFQSRDELRYSIRSILTYAPWVRRIYIATNGQAPSWLKDGHDKVTVVSHEEFIPREYLPTFNSHVIESCLHRIPGLSQHYVYFNDDVFLLRPVKSTDFFTETGLLRGFISSAVIPNSPPTPSDTPSVWAIKNARLMLFNSTGFHLSMKFAHTYHPQRKDIAEEAEGRFPGAFHRCRTNRFRDETDILCTSWLNPCLAYVTGRGVFSRTRAWYFGIRDRSAMSLYASLLKMRGREDCPYSVCLNDHVNPNGPSDFLDYEDHLKQFMTQYFPDQSSCELDEMSPLVSIAAE